MTAIMFAVRRDILRSGSGPFVCHLRDDTIHMKTGVTTMRPFSTTILMCLAATGLLAGGCGDLFDGSGPSTTPAPPLNSAPFDRDLPAEATLATVLQTGDTIYFFGGRRTDGRAVDSVWAFHLGSRTWLAPAPMPTARFSAGAVAVGGAIYVIGGRDNTPGAEAADRLQRVVERYDPLQNRWTTLPPVDAASFDGTNPTFMTTARGRLYAISTGRTSRETWLFESLDGTSWTSHRLAVEIGLEPTLMSDGEDLLLINGRNEYLGGFYRIDPATRRVDRDAPAYHWRRGSAVRWIELDGSLYTVNGADGEDDVLGVYDTYGTMWGFNGIPYDVTTNRHFAPIVTDRGVGTLYLFAPPQLRIGLHYSTIENRFFSR